MSISGLQDALSEKQCRDAADPVRNVKHIIDSYVDVVRDDCRLGQIARSLLEAHLSRAVLHCQSLSMQSQAGFNLVWKGVA